MMLSKCIAVRPSKLRCGSDETFSIISPTRVGLSKEALALKVPRTGNRSPVVELLRIQVGCSVSFPSFIQTCIEQKLSLASLSTFKANTFPFNCKMQVVARRPVSTLIACGSKRPLTNRLKKPRRRNVMTRMQRKNSHWCMLYLCMTITCKCTNYMYMLTISYTLKILLYLRDCQDIRTRVSRTP